MKKRNKSSVTRLYDCTVDLHGMYADEAMQLVRRAIASHPRSSILAIHGDGSGVLRSRIRGALKSGALPCREYFHGEDINASGSDGVTIIFT